MKNFEQILKLKIDDLPFEKNSSDIRYNDGFEFGARWMIQYYRAAIIGTYIQAKMKDHNLPYGIDYYNELEALMYEAEAYYDEYFKPD
jgi:hypothetical protein